MINIPSQLTGLLTNFGASGADCAKGNFFGLRPWYHYLQVEDTTSCNIIFDSGKLLTPEGPIMLILLAVVDDLLRIAGLVAVGFVIYGGYKYITSQGSPDQTADAQKTILNAVIGLVIAIIAVALVSFLGGKLAVA